MAQQWRVSIHAPTKGATVDESKLRYIIMFQSTLPRRERLAKCVWYSKHCRFNPRSHEGSDCIRITVGVLVIYVSIHAPTKGATTTAAPAHSLPMVSIHAPTKGATIPSSIPSVKPSLFQSTLPRRERRERCCFVQYYGGFQSTLPQRERLHMLFQSPKRNRVSIHAPTKGATTYDSSQNIEAGVSIHAPTKGATSRIRGIDHRRSVSIHAPTKGATTKTMTGI